MNQKIELNALIFELTDSCNQNCKFCYNYWKGNKNKTEPAAGQISYRQIRKILKMVFSQASVKSISFSGGEPLLMPKIADLVFYSRLHKANVSILTNGTLLDDELIENFFNLGVRHIQIPLLSSNQTTHDLLTQSFGSWAKAFEAIFSVMKKNPDWISAVLVLNRQNISELTEILHLYNFLCVKNVLVNRFNIGGLGRKYKSELNLSHQELKDAFREIDDFAGKHNINFYSGVCTPICILNPADYKNIAFSFCSKDVSMRPITINYRGDVRFCNHSPRILGNISEKPLSEILYSKDYDAYFNSVPDHCEACQLLKLCGGGCRAASEQVYNTFAKADPLLEIG
jgi:radical SAM protein with 4Fe4S-binding SPASM domain